MKLHRITPALALFVLPGVATAQTPPPNPSLTPPGAPADGVFKTLDQVEARVPVNSQNTPGDASSAHKITQSGSYFLTANLDVASGSGIVVSANNVSLDLNGFTIKFTGASPSATSHGVQTKGDGCRIRNGFVVGFGGVGIGDFTAADPMMVGSPELLATRVVARDVAVKGCAIGIAAGGGSQVSDCIASNGGTGFIVGDALVLNCLASGNSMEGYRAASPGAGRPFPSEFVHCVSDNNSGDGFADREGVFVECQATFNSGSGFEGARSIVDSSAVLNSKGGIVLCLAASNAHRCVVEANGGSGGAGIQIPANNGGLCTVRHCVATNNTGAGILVLSAGNTIIGNTATGNTNAGGTDRDYDIVTGNIVGTIVKQTTTAAIQGNSGGGTGTTDPGANYAD